MHVVRLQSILNMTTQKKIVVVTVAVCAAWKYATFLVFTFFVLLSVTPQNEHIHNDEDDNDDGSLLDAVHILYFKVVTSCLFFHSFFLSIALAFNGNWMGKMAGYEKKKRNSKLYVNRGKLLQPHLLVVHMHMCIQVAFVFGLLRVAHNYNLSHCSH